MDFTNPVGIVMQALLDAGHRAIGLCNSAIGFQRQIAGLLDVEPDRVALEHVGLNHLTWERAARVDGVDRLPDLIASEADSIGEHIGIPPNLIRLLGAIPSYYLRYFYLTDEVLREQLSGAKRSRAEEVMAIEEGLLEMYRDPNLTEKPKLLEKRGGAYYSEAAAQLIASLHDGTGDDQVVDIRNDGAIPDLPADAVVEIPARIDRDGAHPGRFDTAAAGDARAGAAGQGLREAHGQGSDRRRSRCRAQGADRQSAGRPLLGGDRPAGCAARRPIASTCPDSFRKADAPEDRLTVWAAVTMVP